MVFLDGFWAIKSVLLGSNVVKELKTVLQTVHDPTTSTVACIIRTLLFSFLYNQKLLITWRNMHAKNINLRHGHGCHRYSPSVRHSNAKRFVKRRKEKIYALKTVKLLLNYNSNLRSLESTPEMLLPPLAFASLNRTSRSMYPWSHSAVTLWRSR